MLKLKQIFSSASQNYRGLTLDLHCNRFGPTALFQVLNTFFEMNFYFLFLDVHVRIILCKLMFAIGFLKVTYLLMEPFYLRTTEQDT